MHHALLFFPHIDTYTDFTVYTYTGSYNFYVHMVPYSALCFSPLTNTRLAGPTHDHISRYIFHVAAAFAGTVVT